MTKQRDELSLLDIAVFLAEHWPVLVIVPVMVAAATYFGLSAAAPTYIATATITAPVAEHGTATGNRALDMRPFLRAALSPREGVKAELSSDGVKITAEADSEDRSKMAVLAVYREAVSPLIESYEREIELVEETAARFNAVIARLEALAETHPTYAFELAQAHGARLPYLVRSGEMSDAISVLRSEPEIAVSQTGSPPVVGAMAAWFGSCILLVLALAAREGMRRIAAAEEEASKVQRIKDALSLRSQRATAHGAPGSP